MSFFTVRDRSMIFTLTPAQEALFQATAARCPGVDRNLQRRWFVEGLMATVRHEIEQRAKTVVALSPPLLQPVANEAAKKVDTTSIISSTDLPGGCFFSPLEGYHQFFMGNYEKSSGLVYGACLVAHLISGIFLYPTLGFIALIGLVVKLTGVPGVNRYNEKEVAIVNSLRAGVKYSEIFSTTSESALTQKGTQFQRVKSYQVTKENADRKCDEIIKDIRDSYYKISMRALGSTYLGPIEVQLFVNVPVS